ncbi:HIT family protein [Marinicella meishanensis]|uniref:HIT family protein n=1 Tax=Marinicella meishanensis TaxID=2873263 RepID=UPI001CBBB91E|nr:HIT family protein [Marinicella sp. NBU2979]
MPSHPFQIDAQLLADSHPLGHWQQLHLRLHRNAALPWVLIIPETEVLEYCDLSQTMQQNISLLGAALGQHYKRHWASTKINFAAIGNVVQQLHIHVIGRHENDPLWPDVVWGNPLPKRSYSDDDLSQWQHKLAQLLETLT